MAGGRPTEYSEEILRRSEEYLESASDGYKIVEKPYISKDGEVSQVLTVERVVKIPSIEGLAFHLGIHRDTVYAWESTYKEFSDIIEALRAKQANELINKGLSGDYNSTITKVLLGKHGYVS